MAWVGARAGLGNCANPGWLIGAIGPTTVPANVWPKATEVAPNTCCPMPLFPEEATVEVAVLLLLLTGGVVWVLRVADPNAVKYKAMGYGTTC